MAAERGRTLTPRQVAEIWFGTRDPSADQLRKVYAKMQSGALPLNDPEAPPARWTTNEQALAEYLASRRANQEAARHEKGKRVAADVGTVAAPTSFVHRGDKELRDAYTNVWRTYFLAVVGRRQSPFATRAFERAVLAGQVVAVLIIAILLSRAVGFWAPGRPIEERLVAAHLAEIHGWHQVDTWHAPVTDTRGHRIVRVEYRYRDGDSRQVIHTDRTFVVTDDNVTEQSLEDG